MKYRFLLNTVPVVQFALHDRQNTENICMYLYDKQRKEKDLVLVRHLVYRRGEKSWSRIASNMLF